MTDEYGPGFTYINPPGRSGTIGKLAEALSKVQGAIKNAPKTSSNPFFNSHYADLATVWDSCREHLSANGLCVIQLPTVASAPDRVALETILAHSSGEWIGATMEMKPVKTDPQAFGSAITYARRYGLQAIVGIAAEDDDGNRAADLKGESPKATPETVAAKVARNKDPLSYVSKVSAELAESLAEPPPDEERPALFQDHAPDVKNKFDKILEDFKKAGIDAEPAPDVCECGAQIVRESGKNGDFFTCAASFEAFKNKRKMPDKIRHYWRRA